MQPTIAVDLAKSVFEIAVSHRAGRVAHRRRLSRSKLLPFFAQQPRSVILLEACSSAHFWARSLAELGHQPILLPPRLVRPYRHGNKTDRADAKALLEAHRNAQIRPVPVKTIEQQALASIHRLRSGWVSTRTARINTVRGLLRELGVTIPLGANHLVSRVRSLVEDSDSPVPESLRSLIADACDEIRELEVRIKACERQLAALARQIPAVAHLQSVPGIGLLTATALVAALGDARRFPSGRHLASFIGLVPREHSSGHVRRLGRMTKRGDAYLRTLLIHGARSVLQAAKRHEEPDRLRRWALDVERTRGHNKAAVALANKMSRLAWVVLTENRDYRPAGKVA